MDQQICENCLTHQGVCSCTCSFPLRVFCSSCFEKHQQVRDKALALHCQLPLTTISIIDSAGKLRGLTQALVNFSGFQQEAHKKLEQSERNAGILQHMLSDTNALMSSYGESILSGLSEACHYTSTVLSSALSRVTQNPIDTDIVLGEVSRSLEDKLTLMDRVETALDSCSAEEFSMVMKARLYLPLTNTTVYELSLSSPSHRCIGTFPFEGDSLVRDVQTFVQRVAKWSRTCIFFRETELRDQQRIADCNLPKRAVITVWPEITLRLNGLPYDFRISDIDSLHTLSPRLRESRMLSEHCHVLSDEEVVDKDFFLVDVKTSWVFDLIVSQNPLQSLFIRNELHEVVEVPFLTGEETISNLGERISHKVQCTKSLQLLFFGNQRLQDESTLKNLGIAGGDVLNLTRMTEIRIFSSETALYISIEKCIYGVKISNIKLSLEERLGISSEHITLHLRDQEVSDEVLLSTTYQEHIPLAMTLKNYMLVSYGKRKYQAVEFLSKDESVADLKTRIALILGISANQMVLKCNEAVINQADTLAAAGIGENSLLVVPSVEDPRSPRLALPSQGAESPPFSLPAACKVTIKEHADTILVLADLVSTTSLSYLKEKVQEVLTVPIEAFSLTYEGRLTLNHQRLMEFAPTSHEGIVFDVGRRPPLPPRPPNPT